MRNRLLTLLALGLAATMLVGCKHPLAGNWMQDNQKPKLEIYPDRALPEPEVPFHLRIYGRWPAGVTAEEPPWPSYITQMTVRNYRHSLTVEAGWNILEVNLTVEATWEGVYRIPSLPILLHTAKGEQILRTLPLYLEVGYEAARGVTEIRPLKPLQSFPMNWQWLYWLLAGLLLVIIVLAVFWWKRKRQRAAETPWERFARNIDELAADSGTRKINKHTAFRLSYLIRQLVEEETGMAALEMTGIEFHRAAARWQHQRAEAVRALATESFELETIKYTPLGIGTQDLIMVIDRVRPIAEQLSFPETEE